MIDTDILVILDRSGSMQDARKDHEGGLRSFVEDQQSLAGDVRFTLVQFDTDDPCEIVYDRVRIEDVGKIDLIPRGGTPLLDAIGKATTHLLAKQKREPATQTIVLIITDGEENESTEWTKDQVKKRIAEMEKDDKAKILYLGANVDAFHEAQNIGISIGTASGYIPQFANTAYASVSSNLLRSRTAMRAGVTRSASLAMMNFTDDQRAEMIGEPIVTVETGTHQPKDEE